jgi:hypothetical protein
MFLKPFDANRSDTDASHSALGPPICAVFVDSFSFLTALFDVNCGSYESAPNSVGRHSVPKHKVAPVTSILPPLVVALNTASEGYPVSQVDRHGPHEHGRAGAWWNLNPFHP